MKILKANRTRVTIPLVLYAFTTYTFTNASSTGKLGPTVTNTNNSYGSQVWHPNYFSNSSGIQSWTVPGFGTYEIEVTGAYGGEVVYSTPRNGGYGAKIRGRFTLFSGDIINMVVGQKGQNGQNNQYGASGGGGGGSYVYKGSTVLLVAGGGGGAQYYDGAYDLGGNAYTTTTGTWTGSATNGGAFGGGTGAAGGGGTIGNGADGYSGSIGGKSYSNGSAGGTGGYTSVGGFGGGGGNAFSAAGGGGGYSGGDGGGNAAANPTGGGGSYNSGSNQSNSILSVKNHGYIKITKL